MVMHERFDYGQSLAIGTKVGPTESMMQLRVLAVVCIIISDARKPCHVID